MMVRPDFKRVCLALCLMLPSFSGLTDEYRMYKWVDENGTIHFSQFPPEKQAPEQVKIKVSPSISPVESEFDAPPTAEEEPETETGEKEQNKTDDAADLVAQQKAAFEENCRIAQENKQTYENNPGRRFIDADGNVIRFTEEERQAKIQEAQDQIDFYCR